MTLQAAIFAAPEPDDFRVTDPRAVISYSSSIGTIDPTTGAFSYTPNLPGTTPVTITATITNASPPVSDSQSFQITANTPYGPGIFLPPSAFLPRAFAGFAWTANGSYEAAPEGLSGHSGLWRRLRAGPSHPDPANAIRPRAIHPRAHLRLGRHLHDDHYPNRRLRQRGDRQRDADRCARRFGRRWRRRIRRGTARSRYRRSQQP